MAAPKKIKRRWRGLSKRKKALLLVVVVVVAVLIIRWLARGRKIVTSSGLIAEGAQMEFKPPKGGDTPIAPPSKDTDRDREGIRQLLGLSASDPINGEALEAWQRARGEILAADGKWGPMSRTIARLDYWPCEYLVPLTETEMKILAQPTIHWESGSKGFATQNRDGEFKCRWPSNKACTQRLHYGLSWGINQAVQHAGSLGKVLRRTYEIDPAGMNAAVDGHAAELVRITTAAWNGTWERDANGEGYNPRVRKIVDGYLWESPWVERMDRLAKLPAAQQAQWERARDGYVIPGIELAREYGFNDRVSFAVAFDMANHLGRGGASKVFRRAFPSGRTGGPRGDLAEVIGAYEHSDAAREDKVENRRIAIARKTHPGVCYA